MSVWIIVCSWHREPCVWIAKLIGGFIDLIPYHIEEAHESQNVAKKDCTDKNTYSSTGVLMSEQKSDNESALNSSTSLFSSVSRFIMCCQAPVCVAACKVSRAMEAEGGDFGGRGATSKLVHHDSRVRRKHQRKVCSLNPFRTPSPFSPLSSPVAGLNTQIRM